MLMKTSINITLKKRQKREALIKWSLVKTGTYFDFKNSKRIMIIQTRVYTKKLNARSKKAKNQMNLTIFQMTICHFKIN